MLRTLALTLAIALLTAGALFALPHVRRALNDAPPVPTPRLAPPPRLPASDPWVAPARPTRWPTRYVRFETLTPADGLPTERVTCVLAHESELAVGTEAGLALRRAGRWSVLSTAQGLGHAYVTAIARHAPSGDLWVGTLRGLSRVGSDGVERFTQVDSGLANDVVYHVAVEGDVVWAATAAGTSAFDLRTRAWVMFDTTNSIMHEPWCYALALLPQRTFIGVWGGGIVERDASTGEWREHRDPDGEMELDLFADDGPIHDVTSFLAYDEGLLWQTTYFGMSRFDGRAWRTFTAKDTGLPGDFLTHVAARGRAAWVSSDQGLAVVEEETCVTYRRLDDGRCEVTRLEGGRVLERTLLSSAPADNYLLWSQPGPEDIWLATGHGLSRGVAQPAPVAPGRSD